MPGQAGSDVATWLGVLSTLVLAMIGGMVTVILQWATMRADIRYLRRDVKAIADRDANERTKIWQEIAEVRQGTGERLNRLEAFHMTNPYAGRRSTDPGHNF